MSFGTISSVSRWVSTCDAPIKAERGGVFVKRNPSLLQFFAQGGREAAPPIPAAAAAAQ